MIKKTLISALIVVVSMAANATNNNNNNGPTNTTNNTTTNVTNNNRNNANSNSAAIAGAVSSSGSKSAANANSTSLSNAVSGDSSANNSQTNGQTVTVTNQSAAIPDRVRTVPDVVLGSPATVNCGGISGGLALSVLGGGLAANVATINEKCDLRENIRILTGVMAMLPAEQSGVVIKIIMEMINKLAQDPKQAVSAEDQQLRN